MGTCQQVALFFLASVGFMQSVHQARPDHAMTQARLTRAELPLYPPLAWTAGIEGTVAIRIRVEKGSVVETQIKSSKSPLLSTPAEANVRTWQFDADHSAEFVVTYVYKIKGKQTPLPENPKVELDLPRLVKITARPFKPSSDPSN